MHLKTRFRLGGRNDRKEIMTSSLRSPLKKKVSSNTSRDLLFGGVVFDIDNVLVDTRKSYLDTIRWTVDLFLTEGQVPFFQSPRQSAKHHVLSIKDVAEFKLLGGFNDDWDCCYGLLIYLLTLPVKGHTLTDLAKAIDIRAFAKSFRTRPLGVSGIVKKLGTHPYVTIERISRIFQEVYLGRDLFEKVEGRTSLYWQKSGLIRKEKLIFRDSTLKRLKDLGIKLGITTGRSRFEAVYALRRFGVMHYFDAITTMNEVRDAEVKARQSLRKPHPYSLIETVRKLGTSKPVLYIGDLPDDVLTANRSKSKCEVHSVGFPRLSSSEKETRTAMEKLHVDFLLEKPSDLLPLVLAKA